MYLMLQPLSYLTEDIFTIIRRVKDSSSLNIITMKDMAWTRLLTEKYITMLNLPGDESRTFIPCRSETASPTTDWEASWANCRQPGMSPELTSFLWRMIHNLLSTQERLSRMGAVLTAQCKMQGCVQDGSLQHELLHCSKNYGIGNLLVNCLQTIVSDIQPAAILRLEFRDLGEDLTLAATWITAIVMQHIWKERYIFHLTLRMFVI